MSHLPAMRTETPGVDRWPITADSPSDSSFWTIAITSSSRCSLSASNHAMYGRPANCIPVFSAAPYPRLNECRISRTLGWIATTSGVSSRLPSSTTMISARGRRSRRAASAGPMPCPSLNAGMIRLRRSCQGSGVVSSSGVSREWFV